MAGFPVAVAQTIAAPRNVLDNVNAHVRLAKQAAAHGCRLVIFPELSLTGYDLGLTVDNAIHPSDPILEPLQRVADDEGLTIVVGAPVASANGLHIAAICLAPHAAVTTYFKQHLHEGEDVAFAPGRGNNTVIVDDAVVALAICADITHRAHAEAAARSGAGIYAAGCLITEGGYSTDTDLLHGYARSHQMMVLMANYGAPQSRWSSAGQSAIWSASGDLVARAPASGEALVIAQPVNGEWAGLVVA